MMKGKKVLVVEDNDLNMKLVVDLLAFHKLEALCAEDAQTGLQLAHEHLPDLILMDIQLPGMDGLTATRLLKASSDTQKIPVIALTGYAMEEDRKRFIAVGCAGCITKPIDTRGFLEKIQSFFDKEHTD